MTTDTHQLVVIEDANLSRAWARTLLHILDHSGTEIAPLILRLTDFTAEGEPYEDRTVRSALDACLAEHGKYDVETVAWTIFPQSMWRIAQNDRHRLFALYKEAFPRFQAMNMRHNRRGLYFERLIAYGRGPMEGNQLEWIISQFLARRSVRRTQLQASIFDPLRDHVSDAQLGFPCLQHVMFVPAGGSLTINAVYATQQLFDKAYGNWLGLCRLGHFMAREMGLSLTRLNCFVGVEKLERIAKSDVSLQPVVEAARSIVAGSSVPVLPAGAVP